MNAEPLGDRTAPESPFVHAHILDGRGGGRHIQAQEVAAWKPEQGLLWVHLEVGNRPGLAFAGGLGLGAGILFAVTCGDARDTVPRRESKR